MANTPSAQASPFGFERTYYPIVGGGYRTIKTGAITEGGPVISGSHKVSVQLVSRGEIDQMLVRGVAEETIIAGADPIELFAAYDFTASNGILSVDVQTDLADFGTAELVFTVETGTNTVGIANIDTRLQGEENIDGGHRYAKDPVGGLLDLAPSTGGVTITKNRMTGLIWSEYFGWIDLQPPGGGLTVEIESEDRANISGLAYNGEAAGRQGWLGWIDFGKIDGVNGSGGVYIDGDGFFHGTALTQNWGYISFGDYMAIQPGTQFDPPQTRTINKNNSWAKTTWRFIDNNAPVITLVSPVDDTDLTDANKREPTFTFHITEEDNEEVGYLLALERENAPDSWSAYRNYELPYDADDDGTPDLLAPNAFGENYDYQFPTPINPGKYRWRMRAFDKFSAWSDYTEYWHFTVENAVPQTTLIHPAICDTDSPDFCNTVYPGGRRPTFTFTIKEDDGDNLQYVVEISTDLNFPRNNILAQSSPLSPYAPAKGEGAGNEYFYTPAVNLPGGIDLYWRVVATDIYGGEESPKPYNHFKIINQAPTLESAFLQDNNNNTIPDGATTYDTAPTVVWTSADADTGATGILTAHIKVFQESDGSLIGSEILVDHPKGKYRRDLPTLPPEEYYMEIFVSDEDGAPSATKKIFFKIESRDQFGNVGTVVIQSMKNDNGVGRMVGTDDDSTNNKYAWNPTNGWIDLNPVGGGVIVENNRVLGYAWNDALGWIRMNCIAPDADTGIVSGGGQIADNCGGAAWGVTNAKDLFGDFSNLGGKALIEATGDFLYFDEASYLADFPADSGNSEISNINVDISCDNIQANGYVTLGHFLGSAWSPAMGWVAFGRADLQTMGMLVPDAANNFPITEWSCGDNPAPILLEENKYIVFDARADDYSYPIAESSNSAFAAELICDDNLDTESTQIKVDKFLPNGDVVALVNQQDFEIGCKDSTVASSEPDGKLWLTIKKDSQLYYTQTPGLYRVSGTVANAQGYKTEFPVYGDELPAEAGDHLFDQEFIFQIVSAEPDMGNGKTIVPATFPDTLVADGVDSVTFDIRLFDRFDNPVHKTYKYEDTSKAVLKEVSYRAVFLDDVKLDQVNKPGSGVREAVTFDGNVDISAPSVDSKSGGLYTVQYFAPDVEDSSDNILAGVRSIAPTNEDNVLKLHRIEAVVRQVYEATQKRHPVGQTDNNPNQTKVKKLEKKITFAPLVTADVSNFGSFGTVDSEVSIQPIILTNNSTNIDVEDYDWLTLVKTEINGGSNGGSYYEDVQLRDNPAGGGVSSLPKKYYVENSSQRLNSPNIFSPGKGTQFAGLIRSELVNFVSADQPLVINQRMLNPIPAKENNLNQDNFKTMYLAATLRRDSFYEDQEEYPRLVQAIAVKFGDKTARFALASPLSPNPLTYLVMAISGLVHAKEINENNLVGKNAGTDEFSMIGRVYNRPEVRRIMYENYAKITAGKSSDTFGINAANGGGSGEVVSFNDISGFLDGRTSTSQSQTAWLQNGKVRWIERSNTVDALSVNIGSNVPIDIPAGSGPITLLVRGGNVYIRDNISVGKGSTLGIIVLRSEKNSQKGTEGNIFIDPSVTHIEAAMYADGSLMSAKDGNDGTIANEIIEEPEIYDGFSTNLDEISNQLLIRGSVVSQNIIGTSGQAKIPSEDVWLPLECSTSFSSCDQDWRQKSAKRYDFSFLRRYRLVSEINDVDLDGIDDAVDCHVIDDSGYDITINTTDCFAIDNSGSSEFYNRNCQYINGDVMAENYPDRSSDCSPKVTDRIAKDNGFCAFGTPWCPPIYQSPFTISCGTGPTDPCDSATGKFLNRKVGASVLIEYDNRIKNITPVGMDIPAIVDFNRQ